MMRRRYRVLIACYGGGHVQSLIPLAKVLQQDEEIDLTVVGFTTARRAFARAGVRVNSYSLFETYLIKPCPEQVVQFLPEENHPDVTPAETLAYYHVGYHDLVEQNGLDTALCLMRDKGRAAFTPEATMCRYLDETRPDLVVTSTSPRSELALQRAARSMNITSLAVSDLFLQHESSYICEKTYARHVCVIAEYVADFLRHNGCCEKELHVTGNPAFDYLFTDEARATGNEIRRNLGISNSQRLVTWIGTPGGVSLIGKRFVSNKTVIDKLQDFCEKNPAYVYAIRPHPNRPLELSETLMHGYVLGSTYSIESILWASDAILLETSTVGLQAALIGKPVITVAADNYPPYASLGLATDVSDLCEIDAAILAMTPPDLERLGAVGLGDAAKRILSLIDTLLGRERDARNG